jgi:hypothetical protein
MVLHLQLIHLVSSHKLFYITSLMLTVLWNAHGFHVVTMLSPDESFSAAWFIGQNLVPLVQSFFPSG